MKIVVDDVYCCNEEMKITEAIDVETKSISTILICKFCKTTFSFKNEDVIMSYTQKNETP